MRRFSGAAAAPLSSRRSPVLSPCRLSTLPSSSVPRRFVTLAVVKRSPKRLKYSTPRFSKVLFMSACKNSERNCRFSANLNVFPLQEDGLLYVEVDPFGSDSWKLDPIVELLKQGAVGVIPTDTVYVNFSSSLSFSFFFCVLFILPLGVICGSPASY